MLGAALLFGAVGLIAKSVVQSGGPSGDPDWTLTIRDKVAAIIIGVLGGFIVGLTSVGSGVFFGLTLLVVFPLRAHKVVGTDIFHAAILLYVAGAAHWAAGNIDFGILGWLLLGERVRPRTWLGEAAVKSATDPSGKTPAGPPTAATTTPE